MWTIGVAVACVLIALYQGNLLFGLFAILAEIILLVVGKEHPRQLVYVANDNGIFVDNELLRARADLGAFALHDMGTRYLEIILRPRDKFHTYTRILVPRERSELVSNFLSNFLEQFEYEGGMKDVINKHLGI